MRQLLPEPCDPFDLTDLLARHDRVPRTDRPWVMANMVSSVDGAYSVRGRSGALSTPADRVVFHTLRAAVDVVLVAAGTARQERYRRPVTEDPDLLQARRSAGLADHPRLVLVTRTIALPEDLPLVEGPGQVPLVFHPADADTSRAPEGIELRPSTDRSDVELPEVLQQLYVQGARVVLCEGGPTLLGQLHAHDLLDELFLSTPALLVGGRHVGLLGATPEHLRPQRLHRLLEAEGTLFHTYRASTG